MYQELLISSTKGNVISIYPITNLAAHLASMFSQRKIKGEQINQTTKNKKAVVYVYKQSGIFFKDNLVVVLSCRYLKDPALLELFKSGD